MIDISVISTCHTEGRLMHATLKSIMFAIEEAKLMGLAVDWIMVQDRIDRCTRDYLELHKPVGVNLIELDVGDLGLARNYGAKVAGGRFISFLDADDVWSPNWLTAAYAFARSLPNQDVILHAAVGIFFEKNEHLWPVLDSESFDFCSQILFSKNCWAVSSFARREIFLRHPYPASDLKGGFGYEDWHFNCETLAAGIQHKLVPGTFHCYRVKSWKESLVDQTKQSCCLIKPNRLFDLAYQKSSRQSGKQGLLADGGGNDQ